MRRRAVPLLWLVFHGALVAAFLFSLTFAPLPRFNTSLFDILPPSHALKNVGAADAKLSSVTSRSVTMLAYSEDFAAAKTAAERLYAVFAPEGTADVHAATAYHRVRAGDKRDVASDNLPNALAATNAVTAARQPRYDDGAFFESLSLYVDAADTAELTDFLLENRFMLLDADTVSLLEQGDAPLVAEDALSDIYGAFSLTNFSLLERDPFNLSGGTLQRFLDAAASASTAMSVRDGVLAAQKDGVWYVMLRGVLTPQATGLNSRTSAVRRIYAVCDEIAAESRRPSSVAVAAADARTSMASAADSGERTDGIDRASVASDASKRVIATERTSAVAAPFAVEFAYSGVPFHSYESASSAQRQVSVISTIGILLIIVLFLGIFRSPVPALVSAGAVLFSCAMALVAVLLVFREIHVLTFVFGTTLIGTCIDYSVHFFVHWKGDAAARDGNAIRSRILRGIAFSFVSTEICFAALFLAPFPFLKQVSVFLFTGLLSAFLCVVCLYPFISVPSAPREIRLLVVWRQRGARSARRTMRRLFPLVPLALFVVSAMLLLCNRGAVRIDNNLRDMYTMSDSMLRNEKRCAEVLNYGSAGWYYIVGGTSVEELLQEEEQLTRRLATARAEGRLAGYLAASSFVPSVRTQERSYRACAALVPLAAAQYEALGFAPDAADVFAADYSAAAACYITPVPAGAGDIDAMQVDDDAARAATPSSALPAMLRSVTENLWIGEVGGRFYSCVLPLHVTDADAEPYFRTLCDDLPNAHFVNKVADIGAELNLLTAVMLKLLLGAFVLVIVILSLCYPLKTVARIAAIPLLVAFVTVAVLAVCRLPLGFFSVTGLVLVFGLGLDYIIYAVEGERAVTTDGDQMGDCRADIATAGALNRFAILLSFTTTALSFGALAFIGFAPVHTIGLTVFAGLTTACISAFASTSQ